MTDRTTRRAVLGGLAAAAAAPALHRIGDHEDKGKMGVIEVRETTAQR
jgi:hypothetical protein